MGAILKFKPKRSPLDLNADEIERATVERMKAYEALRKINGDLAALRVERERLIRASRQPT